MRADECWGGGPYGCVVHGPGPRDQRVPCRECRVMTLRLDCYCDRHAPAPLASANRCPF